jgi:two-component system chemotaxis sensor kinase CheA
VQAISSGLIDLEKAMGTEEGAGIIERVFREVHSLKGAARAVNIKEIETICQSAEGVLSQAKRREIVLASADLDAFHAAAKEIERLLAVSRGEPKEKDAAEAGDLPSRPEGPPLGSSAGGQALQGDAAADEETVRVPAKQLERLLLQVEELIPARYGAAKRSMDMGELARETALWSREWADAKPLALSLGQGADGGDLRKLLEFLDWNEECFQRIDERISAISRSAEKHQRMMGMMVDSLMGETKRLMLRPFSSITEALPFIARDLCKQNGKEAALTVRGADVEIDRRILQEIKEPILHLVRNSIDHGIEKPEQRLRAGKAPQGSVTVSLEQKSGNAVEITISDDGAGIDPSGVRKAVEKSGMATAEAMQGMGEQEILSFIYRSGISTSPIVTDISGRGLGMAIVREKVEKLGGGVSMETRLGGGTTFRLLLPLTLSTIRGVIVRVGRQEYVIPETFIERVVSTPGSIQTVENRATVVLEGQAVSFVRLRDVLGLPSDAAGEDAGEGRPMVVLSVAERRLAFQVDEVISEQEVLVKRLGPQLTRVRNIGGAALLSTGKIVLILNAADLMKTAATKAAPPRQPEEDTASRRLSILVADDSITARTLLKSILEGAGYAVKTAVDGAEAFASLQGGGNFDILVSDVDMPRLNGFDLTSKVRADRKLADLPVILVTALESPRDRERGIDVGASAYISEEQLRAEQSLGSRPAVT